MARVRAEDGVGGAEVVEGEGGVRSQRCWTAMCTLCVRVCVCAFSGGDMVYVGITNSIYVFR